MIIERHYDDEALIALMESERDRRDAHLPECDPCAQKVESFRTIAGALAHRDVWDTRSLNTEPSTSTIRALRAFADRMSYEDAQAETYVKELLAGPRDEWMPRLEQHPEWRTAGVVRKLVELTTPAILSVPLDGLCMSELSTAIADELEPSEYPSDTVARLRGTAWRDRAYALSYVGRFGNALTAAAHADGSLRECVIDEYDRARVGILRAMALRETEEIAAAMQSAREAGDAFVRFGDDTRLANARIAEVNLLFARSDFAAALTILEELEVRLRHSDARAYAATVANLGYCYWQMGSIDQALQHHDAAAALFSDLGIATEAHRAAWNVSSILARAGRVDEALVRFEELRKNFDALAMADEAALVALDLAELLLVRERFDEVEGLCRAAMLAFERSGMEHSPRALTALAFMQEATQSRKVTPRIVQHVREYLRRLPQEGQLLFAPPAP